MDTDRILDYLYDFAERKNVEILYAKSFGSRAWNLHSDESDYDIGVVFRQPETAYYTMGKYTQNHQETRTLSVSGSEEAEVNVQSWNIDRFFELVDDSNPTALEVLASDKTYIGNPHFDEVAGHATTSFRPIAMMGHYHSLAKNNYLKYVQHNLTGPSGDRYKVDHTDRDAFYLDTDRGHARVVNKDVYSGEWSENRVEQTVKRNLYVARALCYKRFIGETHSMPTLDFVEFLEQKEELLRRFHDGDLYRITSELVEQKRNGEGSEEVGNVVEDVAEAELERDIEDPETHNVRGMNTSYLNEKIEAVMNDE